MYNISEAGVNKLIQSLQTLKATGADGIRAWLLRFLWTDLALVLTIVFQFLQGSINQGVIHSKGMENGKCGTSILKEGKNKVENYRPLSLYNM